LLVHHAKISSPSVTTAQFKENRTTDIQVFKSFLPIIRELVVGEPKQNAVHGPLLASFAWGNWSI
jgi:hypothetical protein